ncbi:MAG TPA: hemerythrin domain-containing protein [Casimicrobiaceae bacterium]|jgi:hemerythrin superfamily protein|nr:hemerythrin domain-containing protein [Casimicrobiaceae bacterium]
MAQRSTHSRSNGHAGPDPVKRKRAGPHAGGRAATERTEARRGAAQREPSPRAAADNALTVLRADHERVAELFARFEKLKSNGAQKQHLAERICDELEMHARVEEELFYPSARGLIGDDETMTEAMVEHDSMKRLIEDLRRMKPGDERYDATVKVLAEYVKHHVKEEQDQIFPKIRAADIDLVALGRAIKTRKRQLKGDSEGHGLLGLAAFPGMMIP